MTFDLRACSHCPVFMLADRAFGTDDILAPIVLVSLPAVLSTSHYGKYWIPEASPLPFAAALVVEGLVLGLIGSTLRSVFRRGI